MQVPVEFHVPTPSSRLARPPGWVIDVLPDMPRLFGPRRSAPLSAGPRHRLLPASLVVLVVVAIATLAAAGFAWRQARLSAEARMQDLAQGTGQRVKLSINQDLQALQSLAGVLASMDALPDRSSLGPALAALRQHYPVFAWIAVASPAGHICSVAAERDAGAGPAPPPIGETVGLQPWFLAGQFSPAVVAGMADASAPDTGVPLYLAVPLRTAEGAPAGVMVAQLMANWATGMRDAGLHALPLPDRQVAVRWQWAAGAVMLSGWPADAPLPNQSQPPAPGGRPGARLIFDADATPAAWAGEGGWVASVIPRPKAVYAGSTRLAWMILLAGVAGGLAATALQRLLLARVIAGVAPPAAGPMEPERAAPATLEPGVARQMEALRQAAASDPMTGLLNRRGLAQAASGLRPGTGAVLLVDIDHFKSVNDRYGHGAGDCVICAVGAALRQAAGASAEVVRYGGEEFLVLLPPEAGRPGELAEHLRATVAGLRVDHGEAQIAVTISIGLARARPGEALAALIDRADGALYRAKRAGRDRVDAAA